MTDAIDSRHGLQGTSRFIAFFDECGDHSMERIDGDFPLFVLATVIVERQRYVDEIIPRLNHFKLRHWDHEGINLHSRDIRKAEGAFAILLNAPRRDQFIADLTALMKELPFTLFVVGIHKQRHKEQYQGHAPNPYELALMLAFERIFHFLQKKQAAQLPVVAEARGKKEDRDLEAAFYKLLLHGTYDNTAERFNRLSCPLLFADKRKNICGVQLADLCAYPSARYILMPDRKNRAFKVVKEHLYDGGNVQGWKVFP